MTQLLVGHLRYIRSPIHELLCIQVTLTLPTVNDPRRESVAILLREYLCVYRKIQVHEYIRGRVLLTDYGNNQ